MEEAEGCFTTATAGDLILLQTNLVIKLITATVQKGGGAGVY